MVVLSLCFSSFAWAEGAAPAPEASPGVSPEPCITVTSESITAEERLLTACANTKNTKPKGENLSPQITFTPVEGAAVYAVVMFDTDANWLHLAVWDATETDFEAGRFADKKQYVGPYPPKGTGDHHYVIEVFALKAAPDKAAGKMNASNDYEKIVKSLDIAGGQEGNILLRGSVTGLYQYGDNTVGE
jgi:phosphatidylethanolamine-binding protein (PEBP) family uncharacterized protein